MEPSPDQVRAQVDRMLSSSGFSSSDRLSRFLRFVVERSLAGEAANLKEYVIGRDVFDRAEDYDPRLDSIVRVEAGRLRSKIDEYYNGPGRADDVVIQLRRGSYAPTIVRRETAAATGSLPATPSPALDDTGRWRLGVGVFVAMFVIGAVVIWRTGILATVARPTPAETIAVLPFSSYSADAAEPLLAARMADGVTSELARLGTLGVVSHTSAQQFAGVRRPLREIAKELDATLILEGTVSNAGGRVRVQVRLVEAARDRKYWVEDFTGSAEDTADLSRRVAQAVSAAALLPRTR